MIQNPHPNYFVQSKGTFIHIIPVIVSGDRSQRTVFYGIICRLMATVIYLYSDIYTGTKKTDEIKCQ
jgi:hypothetical protein